MTDNKKLDIRKSKKYGSSVYLPLTGYLDENKRYGVREEIYPDHKRIIIEDADYLKKRCQNWNETKCEDCDAFKECELII